MRERESTLPAGRAYARGGVMCTGRVRARESVLRNVHRKSADGSPPLPPFPPPLASPPRRLYSCWGTRRGPPSPRSPLLPRILAPSPGPASSLSASLLRFLPPSLARITLGTLGSAGDRTSSQKVACGRRRDADASTRAAWAVRRRRLAPPSLRLPAASPIPPPSPLSPLFPGSPPTLRLHPPPGAHRARRRPTCATPGRSRARAERQRRHPWS